MSQIETMERVISSLLERYRSSNGNIDYLSMMADQSIVKYAEELASFDPEHLGTRKERLAFWINSYNALTIYGVIRKLKQDPKFINRGNSNLWAKAKFFVLQRFNIGGKRYSLRKIENYIRDEFKEPRIHFALNCASRSCPLLKDGLYSSENLNQELDSATVSYIRSDEGAVLDRNKYVLYLSMIFKWYKEDFEVGDGTVIDFVTRYMTNDDRRFFMENRERIEIEYMEYNWSLNKTEEEEKDVALEIHDSSS